MWSVRKWRGHGWGNHCALVTWKWKSRMKPSLLGVLWMGPPCVPLRFGLATRGTTVWTSSRRGFPKYSINWMPTLHNVLRPCRRTIFYHVKSLPVRGANLEGRLCPLGTLSSFNGLVAGYTRGCGTTTRVLRG